MPATATRLADSSLFRDVKSVVVTGVSPRAHFGGIFVRNLLAGGGPRLHLVGREAVDSFQGLPVATRYSASEPPDLVVLASPPAIAHQELQTFADLGVRSFVLAADAYGSSAGPDGIERTRELAELLDRYDRTLHVLGPGTAGFVDVPAGVYASLGRLPEVLRPGQVSIVSQSGAVISALLRMGADAGWGFNRAISTGMEASISLSAWINDAADSQTGLIILVVETIRDPARLRRSLDRLVERGIRLATVTIGRSGSAERIVRGHAGGLIDWQRPPRELFERYGPCVGSIEELVDACGVIAQVASQDVRQPADGVAVISVSGGAASLACDSLEDAGLTVAHSDAPPLPCDLGGRAAQDPTIFASTVRAAIQNDRLDAVLALYRTDEPRAVQAMADAVGNLSVAKPIVLSGIERVAAWDGAAGLPALGIAPIAGLRAAACSLAAALQYERVPPDLPPAARGLPTTLLGWLPLLERSGLRLADQFVVSAPNDLDAIEEIRLPAYLKLLSVDVPHRSVAGLITRVAERRELREAATAMLDAAAEHGIASIEGLLLQQAVVGPELYVALADQSLGTRLLVGPGGTDVERSAEVGQYFLPLSGRDRDRLRTQLVRQLHDRDVVAVVHDRLLSFAQWAAELRGTGYLLELNPVIVTTDGPVVVDWWAEQVESKEALR